MAHGNVGHDIPCKAGEDLRTKQFRWVEIRTAMTVHQASQTSAICLGILQNKPNIGEQATVRFEGVTKIRADIAITVNALVSNTASAGAAIVTSGTLIKGQALTAALSGGIFTGLIAPIGLQRVFTVVDSDVT